jgi:hypothetical protein
MKGPPHYPGDDTVLVDAINKRVSRAAARCAAWARRSGRRTVPLAGQIVVNGRKSWENPGPDSVWIAYGFGMDENAHRA